MESTTVIPHIPTFTLFAIYTFAFSTDFTSVPVIFLIDYSLATIQTVCLITFIALYPKTFKFVIVPIKTFSVLLIINFLSMSIIGFTSNIQLFSSELIKLYITRLIISLIEVMLIFKFPIFPHPPTKPMSKPPSYSTFAPLYDTI